MDADRELAQLEAKLLKASFAYQKALLHDALTTGQVATLLNIHADEVVQRLARHELLGIFAEGKWQFPAAQFQQGKVVPGFGAVLQVLSDNGTPPLAQWAWLVEPHPTFGTSPINLLRSGEIQRVINGAWAVNGSCARRMAHPENRYGER